MRRTPATSPSRDPLRWITALCFGACAAVLGIAPAAAQQGPASAVVVLIAPSIPAQRGEALGSLVEELLASRAAVPVLAASLAKTRLAENLTLAEHRKRARQHLEQATSHVRHVRYPQALTALATAEAAAHEGLAALLEPALLGEICFQRGFALLALDPAAARVSWRQSFVWTPVRSIAEDIYPPKIVQLLEEASASAARGTAPAFELEQLLPAGSALEVSELWVASAFYSDDTEALHLGRADLTVGRLGWFTRLQWPAQTALAEVQRRITTVLPPAPLLLTQDLPARPDPQGRWLVWTTAAAGGSALLAGAVLAGLVTVKESDAERLADQDPLASYVGQARELEDTAWRYQTAAWALFSGGATALAGAAAIELLPEDDPQARRWLRWSATGVSAAGLTVGIALALVADQRQSEAESLTGAAPLIDYEPRIADLEASGRRYQQAAVATFSLGGAAAAVALACWLWPDPERDAGPADDEQVDWQVGPDGVSLSVTF